ncbi:MAG: hypothetical protein Ta2B_00010 [Termitinemataceae bacterium]|nr:MAG: hypothetical protein Ta2B_00010 [Termitinemataceae bacterium]
MPNAVYLTFLSAKHSQNTSLFSVLPSQYAADEHPNGLLGVNPDGKFVFTMIKQSGYEMVDITDDAVNASHEIHSVMGMQPGDYVLVPSTYDSTMEDVFEDYSVGDPIHQVLVHSGRNDGGYRVVKSGVTLTARTAINKSTHLEEPPSATTTLPTQFAASDFLGMENDAVQKLYAAIPVFAGKPSTGNYLTDLNTMVNSNDLITKIRAAKPDLVFDRETEAQIAEIIIANETSTDDMKRANMFFLSIAFPENCPTFPDMNGQNLAEVHPLFSLNYSAEDNLGGAPIGTPNDKIAVESSMVGGGALYAAASPSYDAKYSEYATKRTAIENTFNKEFAGRFGLDSTSLVGKVNPFITPDAALKIGINCAVSCWWGKLELAAGAAIFIKAEITLGAGGGTINERSIFDLAKNSKPISIFKGTRQFMIGAVILDVEIGQDLDFTISLGANLAASDALFAGFCGLYGAKAAVGVNYGVKWKWGFIPVGITFDPYAKATVYNESANYSGRMYQGSGAVSVITFKATPKLIASQKVILWNTVWVKAANTLSFPASYTCDSAKNPMNKLSIDIDYKLGFSAGLQIDIKIWRKSYAIAEYELIHEQKNIYKKDW